MMMSPRSGGGLSIDYKETSTKEGGSLFSLRDRRREAPPRRQTASGQNGLCTRRRQAN